MAIRNSTLLRWLADPTAEHTDIGLSDWLAARGRKASLVVVRVALAQAQRAGLVRVVDGKVVR